MLYRIQCLLYVINIGKFNHLVLYDFQQLKYSPTMEGVNLPPFGTMSLPPLHMFDATCSKYSLISITFPSDLMKPCWSWHGSSLSMTTKIVIQY